MREVHSLQRIRRWRERADAARRRTGLTTARTREGDRLLQAPVFVLSSVRSGSTLLRVMLNSHSQLHAPHELHLNGLRAEVRTRYTRNAMTALGLDDEQLQFLLWDRVLHRELVHSGKQIFVDKTPANAMMWRKILRCWPDARFVFLLRHPGAVTDSWHRTRKHWPRDQVAGELKRYMDAVEQARSKHGGLSVRYEDLTADPARELRRTCEFLNIPYEPAMIDYRVEEITHFRPGLGDWSRWIRSGRVRPAKPLPPAEQIPTALVPIARQWGYLD